VPVLFVLVERFTGGAHPAAKPASPPPATLPPSPAPTPHPQAGAR
jgi:hypothetical protein